MEWNHVALDKGEKNPLSGHDRGRAATTPLRCRDSDMIPLIRPRPATETRHDI